MSKPSSITATTTSREPRVMSHAGGACTDASAASCGARCECRCHWRLNKPSLGV